MKYLHCCLDSIISRWRRTKSRGGEDDEWLEVEALNNISRTVLLDEIRVYNQYINMSAADLELRPWQGGGENKEEWEEGMDLRTLLKWSEGTLHLCFIYNY